MMSFSSIAVLVCIGVNLPTYYSQTSTTRNVTGTVLCDPIPICKKSKYRTINGHCNNLKFPLRGAAQTPYLRLVPNNYADGLNKFPTDSTGQPLPSARLVSFTLFPFKPNVDRKWNLNSMQFGQIVAHDMSLTALNPQTIRVPIVCCDENHQPTANASRHPCIPIWIPAKIDPVHPSDGKRCLNAIRTLMDTELPCIKSNKTADQINGVTAYADLSLVYGSTDPQAESLRERSGGLLVTNEILEREFPPQAANVTRVCDMATSPNESCFKTGDVRINQNPELALLQVILHRDHNEIARNLKSINPHWNDEIVFQEARRIAIAKYQHILYYEWLPTFLGFNNLVKYKLIHPGAKGYINDYNNRVNAAVSNEHATASLRDPHKWIKGHLLELTESRRFIDNNRLSDLFNKPNVITEDDHFDNFVRGMTCQARGNSDQYFDPEITTFLFKRNRTVGTDLRALDIQRARDHGIGTYVSTRAHFKLSVPKTFSDLRKDISEENIKILKSLYKSVKDVDLSVAGALENIVPGTAFGPTFLSITLDQFGRSRFGDRYFYENGADPLTAFTLDQLTELRKASMARLLCDNSDNIRNMQRKAFEQLSKDNKLVPCDLIPEVNLKFWMDTSNRGKKERRRRNSCCHHCCC